MIKLTEEQIIDGQNKAYLKAGHNAYFGNGFQAGVKFALKQVNKLHIHGVIERLPIGTEVTIIDHEDWGEQRGTKKTITDYIDFGKKQGYLLDGVGIYLAEDFKVNVL